MSDHEQRDEAQGSVTDGLMAALGAEQRELNAEVESTDAPEVADPDGLLDAVFAAVDQDAEDGTDDDDDDGIEGEDDDADGSGGENDDGVGAEPEAGSQPAEPVSLASRRSPAAWVLPLVAVAAAVMLWVAMRPQGPVAPGYQLVSVQAGRAEVRGAESPEQIRVFPGDAVALTLAPEHPVETAVALAVVARDAEGNGTARRPSSGVQVDASGSIRVDTTLDTLADVGPGAYSLEFWVGPEDALPKSGDVAAPVKDPRIAVVAVPILVPSER